MNKTVAQRERIIENIFELMCQTEYKELAKRQMGRDLSNKNISLDHEKGTIKIQDRTGQIDQYTITIN